MHAGACAGDRLNDGPLVIRPPRRLGLAVGAGIVLWCLALALPASLIAFRSQAEFKTFLAWLVAGALLIAAGVVAGWCYNLWRLSYTLTADALLIRWGFRQVEVPVDTILRIIPGRTLDPFHLHGVNWPGLHVGHTEVKPAGTTLFFSTHRNVNELVVVHTAQDSYGLTILDQPAFAEAIQERTILGTVDPHRQRSRATGIAAYGLWRDGLAIGTALLAVAACAVLSGFIMYRYPDLPAIVQLNFPGGGATARIGEKEELLRIGYVGGGALIVNLVAGALAYTRERAAGIWLFASGGLLQVVLLGAAIAAIERS